MDDLLIAVTVLSVASLAIVFLYLRFRRAAPDVPSACQVAAAIALIGGSVTAIAGIAHSVAVASLVVRMPEYGPLQVLWFATGLILIYTGATNAAMHGGIKVGRRSAIAVAAGASLLLVVYLLLVNPLPGGGGTVPPMLALWSLYLLSLGTAAITAIRLPSRRGLTSHNL